LARVVATPVQKSHAKVEPPIGVLLTLGVVLRELTLLPPQNIVNDGVHDGADVPGLPFYALELATGVANTPEVAWNQGGHMGKSELHRQFVSEISCAQHAGDHGPTAFVPEHRDSITHAHQTLVASISVHARVGGHLQHRAHVIGLGGTDHNLV
jgi:hypothetical protein